MKTLYIKVLRGKLIALNIFNIKKSMNGYSKCHDPGEKCKCKK